jgi:hypothetical protein
MPPTAARPHRSPGPRGWGSPGWADREIAGIRWERSLSAVLAGRTVVAIAHRLHTAHDADRVAVMEAGQLVELGTHAELLANGKSYARLWQSWSSGPVTTVFDPSSPQAD